MHVEVQDAYWLDLLDAAGIVNEKVPFTRLDKPNNSISLRAYKHLVIGRE